LLQICVETWIPVAKHGYCASIYMFSWPVPASNHLNGKMVKTSTLVYICFPDPIGLCCIHVFKMKIENASMWKDANSLNARWFVFTMVMTAVGPFALMSRVKKDVAAIGKNLPWSYLGTVNGECIGTRDLVVWITTQTLINTYIHSFYERMHIHPTPTRGSKDWVKKLIRLVLRLMKSPQMSCCQPRRRLLLKKYSAFYKTSKR
jgi:hypothetical protein